MRPYLKNAPKILLRLTIATVAVSAFMVLTQDFQVFPGVINWAKFGFRSDPPADVHALRATAADGHSFDIWRMQPKESASKWAVLLFHGNADHLHSTVGLQRWFASLGVRSYAIEYRGFAGRDSGWPSEEGFYLDADAAVRFLKENEGVESKDIISVGHSIGTGIAAYTAQKFNTGMLLLISPYAGLRQVVQDIPFLGLLAPFLKYNFPTAEFVKGLKSTCVVAAHGLRDSTIAFHHSEELKSLYRGDSTYTLIISKVAGHNDLLRRKHREIAHALGECDAKRKNIETSIAAL